MKISLLRYVRLSVVVLGVLSLAACGSNPTRDSGSTLVDTTGDNNGVTAATSDFDADGLEVDPNSVAGRAPTERIIFFDFDTSQIRSEYVDIIVQHGRYLAQNPGGRIRLEGHTDERGSREYNIALGERRAKSIANRLQLQGVSSAQVRSISYGEELPIDENHSPDAWAKNRRVQIIYENVVPN